MKYENNTPEVEVIQHLVIEETEYTFEKGLFIDKKRNTLWATGKTIAELYGTSYQNILLHFNNIVSSQELNKDEVCKTSKELFKDITDFNKYSFINPHKRGRPDYWYNLDAIISIGYRVNSTKATSFRKWSTQILSQFMREGYVLNEHLLNQNPTKFDDLIQKIKEIRTNEKNAYERIKHCFTLTIDYDSKSEIAQQFFTRMQNIFLNAVAGGTAAEIIDDRVDSNKPHMGLTSYSGGDVTTRDIKISKNYLTESELRELRELSDGILSFMENFARRQIDVTMVDLYDLLIKLLEDLRYNILKGNGMVSHDKAIAHAKSEYEKFKENDYGQTKLDGYVVEGS